MMMTMAIVATTVTINNNSMTNNAAVTCANAARLSPHAIPTALFVGSRKVPRQFRPSHLNRGRTWSRPVRFENMEAMPLSHQLRTFADNWRRKAQAYAVDDLTGAFDRFFTLYVVFNRLYAEATYRLAHRGRLNLREPFPDSRAAQGYVIQFCGAETLTRTWEGNENTAAAIREIAEHLHNERSALKLNPMTGDRQPEKDHALGAALHLVVEISRPKAFWKLSMRFAAICFTDRRDLK
jgi:hypothetical protein